MNGLVQNMHAQSLCQVSTSGLQATGLAHVPQAEADVDHCP